MKHQASSLRIGPATTAFGDLLTGVNAVEALAYSGLPPEAQNKFAALSKAVALIERLKQSGSSRSTTMLRRIESPDSVQSAVCAAIPPADLLREALQGKVRDYPLPLVLKGIEFLTTIDTPYSRKILLDLHKTVTSIMQEHSIKSSKVPKELHGIIKALTGEDIPEETKAPAMRFSNQDVVISVRDSVAHVSFYPPADFNRELHEAALFKHIELSVPAHINTVTIVMIQDGAVKPYIVVASPSCVVGRIGAAIAERKAA